MAELLFISPQEMTQTTLLGGNVDFDKYKLNIINVQRTVIEPLLGTLLYDKIVTDVTAETIAGDYLELYTDFVKPITKNEALAQYVTVSGFMITNAGAFKNAPENAELMDKDEKALISTIYSGLADTYVIRFEKWICKHTITEYKLSQDEVNASKDIDNTGGWYLGSVKPTIFE